MQIIFPIYVRINVIFNNEINAKKKFIYDMFCIRLSADLKKLIIYVIFENDLKILCLTFKQLSHDEPSI